MVSKFGRFGTIKGCLESQLILQNVGYVRLFREILTWLSQATWMVLLGGGTCMLVRASGSLYAIIRKARIAWLLEALYPCFAITGEAIGNALQGHEIGVSSVAVTAESKLIVLGSWDKTIRQSDADTGEAVGSQLQEHFYGANSLDTNSDCELIVSGYSDEMIRR